MSIESTPNIALQSHAYKSLYASEYSGKSNIDVARYGHGLKNKQIRIYISWFGVRVRNGIYSFSDATCKMDVLQVS